jgi:O-antigen/teichoic acid export membrane protein
MGGVKGVGESSLFGKAGPLVVARFVATVVTFCIPLVLARRLSLPEYGTYKQLLLIASPLLNVLPFGMASSLFFFIPRAEAKRPFLVQTYLYLLVAGVLAGWLIVSFLGFAGTHFSNPALAHFRWELAAYATFFLAASALEATLTTQGKTKTSGIIYVISEVVKASSLILPVLLGYGLTGAMTGLATFTGLRVICAWILLSRTGEGPLFSAADFKAQLAYALPFGAAMVLNLPQQLAHQYAVSATVSPELFAIYSVGCFQLPLVDLLYQPTSEVLMVEIGELERAGRLDRSVLLFREAASKLSFFFLPLAAFLFVAAPEFIGGLFGAKFLGAVPIFRVAVLAVVLATLPMDGVLRARNETRFLFITYLCKALITIPLVYFGVKHFSMMGGITAWAGAELVGKGLLLWRTPQALSSAAVKIRLRDTLPFKRFGQALLAAGVAALGVVLLRAVIPAGWEALPRGFLWRMLPLAFSGLLFAVGYVAMLAATGMRPARFLQLLRRQPA